MQRSFITTFLFLAAVTLSNCSRKKTSAELINDFYNKKSKLAAIIKNIQSDKILDSLFYNVQPGKRISDIKTIYPDQYKMLKEVGITEASAHKDACSKIIIHNEAQEKAIRSWLNKENIDFKWYYFKTNWRNDNSIFLIYNECDTATMRKGFYNKDEYQNETWGLGDNWSMFKLVKYKDHKQ